MNRISSTATIAIIPLILVVAAYAVIAVAIQFTKAPQPASMVTRSRPTTVSGLVPYPGLAVPTVTALITVPLMDASRKGRPQVVFGEQATSFAGGQALRGFTVGHDLKATKPADGSTDDPLMVQATASEGAMALGGSWSPFDLALSSGRLSHFTH